MSLVILSRIGLRFSLPLLGRLVRFGLPLVPMAHLSAIWFCFEPFLSRGWVLQTRRLLAQVGLFSLGNKFAIVVDRFVNVPFNSYWGPRRMELVCNSDDDAKEMIARVCTYANFVCTYFAPMLCAAVENVIEIMANPSYHGAHQVVPFIALTYIALGLEPHLTTGVLYRGKTVWLTWISLVALTFALVWNYVFIPQFGLIGAATANLAAIVIRETSIYYASQRVYRIPFELGRIAKMLFTASILYILCMYVSFPSPYLTMVVRFGIVALFPVALFGIGFYRPEETRFLGRLLRKGRGTLLQAWNGQ